MSKFNVRTSTDNADHLTVNPHIGVDTPFIEIPRADHYLDYNLVVSALTVFLAENQNADTPKTDDHFRPILKRILAEYGRTGIHTVAKKHAAKFGQSAKKLVESNSSLSALNVAKPVSVK